MLVVGAGLTTQVWPVSNYHLRSDNQDSNARQQSMPSPPKIQYGNWSARTGSETETQRTARVLGILFPNPPLSSEGEVAARRQGYNAGPAACYIEVPATLSSSLLSSFRLHAPAHATLVSDSFCPTWTFTTAHLPSYRCLFKISDH